MRVWLQPTPACATMTMFGLEQLRKSGQPPLFLIMGWLHFLTAPPRRTSAGEQE